MPLRIIGGVARGRTILAPEGRSTRPTSDRVREALFAIVEARLDLEGRAVLDLYAGSGALGLEAASRGAARVVFVEHSPSCQRVIRDNAARLGLEARCTVLPVGVDRGLELLEGQGELFELVLADPPYAEDPGPLLERLVRSAVVSSSGLVVLEHDRRTMLAEGPQSGLVVRRRHGDTVLSVYAPTQSGA
jgi:16S rRNA (guanine966-N2)-methyltransferase